MSAAIQAWLAGAARDLADMGLPGEEAWARLSGQQQVLARTESPHIGPGIYLRSFVRADSELGLAMVKLPSGLDGPPAEGSVPERRRILLLAPAGSHRIARTGFAVEQTAESVGTAGSGASGVTTGLMLALAPLSLGNARELHRMLPWTAPVSLRDRNTTIGMGDRLGVATPGHIRIARQFAVSPVLAQQSVRENEFIGRSFPEVVANATFGVFQEGFRDGWGADGDHLKTIPAIDTALDAGIPMITLDLTEVMRPEVADWTDAQVEEAYAALHSDFRMRVDHDHVNAVYQLRDGTMLEMGETEAKRCAVMYGLALDLCVQVDRHLRDVRGEAYDLEISIDETTTPTLPGHHLFIARELQMRDVRLTSMAPRFIGDFQKAIDYIGDLKEFHKQFRVHAGIAAEFGPYRVSVHSGSDKFSVYRIVGEETNRHLHLKTSGTSWLVALGVIAKHEPVLYRRIHAFVLDYYPDALRAYHITAEFSVVPDITAMPDAELPGLLEHPDCRQMLHISYGGVLGHPGLRSALYEALAEHEEAYASALSAHFRRHLEPLLGG